MIKWCVYTLLFAGLVFVCMEMGWQMYKLTHQEPFRPFPPPEILYTEGDDRNSIDRQIFTHDNCIEWNRGRKAPIELCDVPIERVEF